MKNQPDWEKDVFGEEEAEALPKKKKNKWLTPVVTVLIVATVLTAICAAVEIVTGSSVFSLLRAGLDDDYRPTVDDDAGFLPVTSGDTPVTSDHAAPRRKEGVYNFLLVGINDNDGMNHTDTMMVVQYDVSGKVNIVQIPRDGYFSESSHNFHKINSYFTASYNKTRNGGGSKNDSIVAGITALAGFLERNYAIKIDYYVTVGLDGFEKIIDAVGGVTVVLPYDLDYDTVIEDLHIHLKKGEQHLDGKEALKFCRYRKGYLNGDYGRMDAQKIFMSAFLKQIKENFSVSQAVALARTAYDCLLTSIPADDFVYFAKTALSFDLGNVSMQILPSNGAQAASGAWYDIVCRDDAVKVINEKLNVYENVEITAALFDPNGILYDHGEQHSAIYFGKTEKGLCDEYSADTADGKVKLYK